jgi:hypothetical protein
MTQIGSQFTPARMIASELVDQHASLHPQFQPDALAELADGGMTERRSGASIKSQPAQ